MGFCEVLAISKFNETDLLRRDLDWVHFEPNEDERNVRILIRNFKVAKILAVRRLPEAIFGG